MVADFEPDVFGEKVTLNVNVPSFARLAPAVDELTTKFEFEDSTTGASKTAVALPVFRTVKVIGDPGVSATSVPKEKLPLAAILVVPVFTAILGAAGPPSPLRLIKKLAMAASLELIFTRACFIPMLVGRKVMVDEVVSSFARVVFVGWETVNKLASVPSREMISVPPVRESVWDPVFLSVITIDFPAVVLMISLPISIVTPLSCGMLL